MITGIGNDLKNAFSLDDIVLDHSMCACIDVYAKPDSSRIE